MMVNFTVIFLKNLVTGSFAQNLTVQFRKNGLSLLNQSHVICKQFVIHLSVNLTHEVVCHNRSFYVCQ